MTKQMKFTLAILLQVTVLFAIIIFKLAVLAGGTDVLLRIRPVDPRDILRGDYATFQYDISTPNAYASDGQQISTGDTVYILLGQNGLDKYWGAIGTRKTKPTDGSLFIKGKVSSGASGVFDGSFRVVYGIEDYFIPEGKGRGFSFWNKEAAAKVAVDKDGNAIIKQVYVDDKLWP